MTEQEWVSGADPNPMLEHVRQTIRLGRAEGRKNYLLAVACGRLVWSLVADERLRRGILWAEAFADDEHDPDEWGDIVSGVHHGYRAVYDATGGGINERFEGQFAIALAVSRLTQKVPSYAAGDILVASRDSSGLNPTGAAIVRDIFGNPFRPVVFSPEWRTTTVIGLAAQMYESRDFTPMPILADALQDAGCDHEYVLSHCRDEEQVHVRGCWVVDSLLGKG